MNPAFINGKYYITSSTRKEVYTLNKDLECTCKSFLYRGYCKHQQAVIKYLQCGAWIDISKIPMPEIKEIKKRMRRD